jgi:hypothetical protein
VVNEFEIWWNDGKYWYSMKQSYSTKWSKVKDFLSNDFSVIKKFDTNLNNDYNTIATIDNFPKFEANEIRLVFNTFSGNVLAAKVGIIVNDPDHVVCPKRCKAPELCLVSDKCGCNDCQKQCSSCN